MLKLSAKSFLLILIVIGITSTGFSQTMDVIGVYGNDGGSIAPKELENETLSNTQNPEISQIRYNNEGHELVDSYIFTEPETIDTSMIDYNNYQIGYYYVVALNNAANVRVGPSTETAVLRSIGFYGKMNVFEKVKGQYFSKSDSDEWYRVYWYEEEEIKTGYVYSKIVELREFRVAEAEKEILKLEAFITPQFEMGKINNYKNYQGRPPLLEGESIDDFGISRDQAAPLYETVDRQSTFRYIIDGQIFDIIERIDDMYYVYVYDYDVYGYLPAKYVSTQNAVKNFRKMIFVDITNQNVMALEKNEDQWALKSLSFATTGKEAKYKEPTIAGTYAAIEKKSKFLYLDDETDELDGYAPYAIRFNGGAYLHGFPVNYQWEMIEELVQEPIYDDFGDLVQEAVFEEKRVGSPIDPGIIEYSYTLGTIPLSHKCVRNPTSHAKFMYDWIILNETLIVVID